MTHHEHEVELEGIPTLLVHRGTAETAAARGVVLFHHGLGSEIGANLKELRSLADAGFLALGVDAVGHGRRRWPDFDEVLDGPGFDEVFIGAVRDTARETGILVSALADRWGPDLRVGMGGISMGGFVTYRSLVEEPRLACAVSILGSPRWAARTEESPEHHLTRLWPRPLLSLNAGEDRSVPPGPARELHEKLADHYRADPTRHRFVEFPGVGHFMPEPDWNRLWDLTLGWFERWLPAS